MSSKSEAAYAKVKDMWERHSQEKLSPSQENNRRDNHGGQTAGQVRRNLYPSSQISSYSHNSEAKGDDSTGYHSPDFRASHYNSSEDKRSTKKPGSFVAQKMADIELL